MLIKIKVEANNKIQVKILSTEIGKRRELDSSKLHLLEVALQTETQTMKQHIMPIIVKPIIQ